MFLRDKDWAQLVKTNHFPRITILLLRYLPSENRVSAQAKAISEVVKDFEQSRETYRGCDSNWTKNNVSASKTEMVVLDFPSHGV
jgi:hypothetical protein